MEEVTILIKIAERQYRLTVNKEEEEYVLAAAEKINKMLGEYSASFAFKDKQDLLSMVCLQNTTALNKKELAEHNNEVDMETRNALIEIRDILNEHSS